MFAAAVAWYAVTDLEIDDDFQGPGPDLVLVGAGMARTRVLSDGAFRLFEIRGAWVEMSELILTLGASEGYGGGGAGAGRRST